MKELILLNLFQFINATNIHQQLALKDKIVTFIYVAEFQLDQMAANCTKRLVVNSLHDYIAAPASTPAEILMNHYGTLAKVLA